MAVGSRGMPPLGAAASVAAADAPGRFTGAAGFLR